MKPLEGRAAVVTGGGRGIGAAVAEALAADGAAVLVTARTQQQIDEVAESLGAAGHTAFAVACDVADPASVERLAERATELLGVVDILINNAGVAASAPVKNIRLADWERLFAVNTTGTLLCTQAFLPAMLERGWGRVVNVASIAGLAGSRYTGAYSASKHAVIGLTRCTAAEVADRGVTVNAVCPGYVDTEMTEETVARIQEKTGIGHDLAMRHLVATSPQGRLLESAEVAFLVRTLCHPLAKGINGQAIALDGGTVLS